MRPLEMLVKQEDPDWEPVAGDCLCWARMGGGHSRAGRSGQCCRGWEVKFLLGEHRQLHPSRC